jgi:hypothetical protein
VWTIPNTHPSIYEGRLFVCFVCNNEIHQTGMFQIGFLISLESSWSGGFHGVWTCSAKVLEYWIIFSLKMKLNCSWKFQRNWNVPLVLLERSWWAGFNGIYLVRVGYSECGRYWFFLKWFLAAENSNKFQKTRFRKGKISWGHGNTWAKGSGHTSEHEFEDNTNERLCKYRHLGHLIILPIVCPCH